jgi:hypothetical protein
MPDVSELLNATSVYAGMGAILFSIWYPAIDAALRDKRPDDVRNSTPYKTKMKTSLLGKSVPLSIFLIAYITAMGGSLKALLAKSHFTIVSADPSRTLFVFSYLFMVYIAGITLWQAIQLGDRWARPVKKSARASPSVRRL